MAYGEVVTAEQVPMMGRQSLLVSTFLLIVSVSLGATITTAPVVVVENEEVADRGDMVAETASGIYEQLVQVNEVDQRCPSNLSVTLNHETDEEYNVALPTGLVDVNGDCKPLDNFTSATMVMKNFGRALSTLAVVISKSTIMEHSTHLSGQLPEGALACSPLYPGQAGRTFGRLSITSLKEPIVLLLRMALERIGVPSDTLDGVFKKHGKLEEWVSDRQALTGDAWRVQAAMKPLEMAFALLLGPKKEESGDGNLLGLLKDACFYIGGQRDVKSVMQKIKNLVESLLPLARRAKFARFGLPVPDFFALRKACKINPAAAAINQLSLEKVEDLQRGEDDIGEMFAVRINGGKDACARANVTRFVQMEKELNASNPDASSPSYPSGPYVVNLVDEMIHMFDRYGAGSGLFKSLLADEQVAGYFPDILQAVAEFEFKTNILVGTVDLSNCTAGIVSGGNSTFVLINRPSIMIECGDGLTNNTCISKKNVLLNFPYSGSNDDDDNNNSEAQNSVRQIFDESSLLLVPENKTDSCVFSTLRPVA